MKIIRLLRYDTLFKASRIGKISLPPSLSFSVLVCEYGGLILSSRLAGLLLLDRHRPNWRFTGFVKAASRDMSCAVVSAATSYY